jgi:DnaJ-class molecular chaperone
MYFNNCNTLDEAKTLFRELSKKLHPDTSGSDTAHLFISMFKEFKAFKPRQTNEQDDNFNADEFYNQIKNFDGLNDIRISFVGSFIWLEDIEAGATFYQKDIIKAVKIDGYNNARFASQKKLWYFSPLDYKQKSRSNKGIDEIKSTYGCTTFTSRQTFKIA